LKGFLQHENKKTPDTFAKFGLAMLVVIVGLSIWSAVNYRQAILWRRHTDIVIAQIAQLKLSVESVNSNQRAYYIQPQYQFLKAYRQAQDEAKRILSVLHDLVADNPGQTQRVDAANSLLKNLFATKDLVISGVIKGDRKLALEAVQSERDRGPTDRLQSDLNQLDDTEQLLLKLRNDRAEKDFQLTSLAVICGLIFSFITLYAANFLLQREVRRRQKVEEELQIAQRKAQEASDLKSNFLANMSHEIRTPLNGIIGMLKLLEHTPMTDQQTDYVDTLKVSSTALLSLINEILDLSKIESGKMQLEETNFEMASLVNSAVSIVDYAAKSKGLKITSEITPDVPEFLLGDPLRLRQILLNLLQNAVKFSEQGTISLRVSSHRPIQESRAGLLFEVTDQGIGFDEIVRKKLFQSFTQGDDSTSRRFGGSGLGLAISKQIVHLMNGQIDVDSKEGQGSRFYFTVDLKLAKYELPVQNVVEQKLTLQLDRRILIAEDNRVNQKVAAEMIKLLGCTCKVVDNGKLAIEALREEDFDLILMDAQMPIMDGYEATRLIRDGAAGPQNKTIPILATTANAIKGDIELCLKAGMNDYLSKPISYSDLLIKIEKWISRGKAVIDESTLGKLQQQEARTGKSLMRELIEIFSQDGPELVQKMRQYLNEKKYESLPAFAHNLKSSAATLGAVRLKEIAERIERAKGSEMTEQQWGHLIDSLEAELHLVIQELRNKINISPSPEREL
jgi:signal transduction histidine kinase/CheY-like chemotaxis protein